MTQERRAKRVFLVLSEPYFGPRTSKKLLVCSLASAQNQEMAYPNEVLYPQTLRVLGFISVTPMWKSLFFQNSNALYYPFSPILKCFHRFQQIHTVRTSSGSCSWCVVRFIINPSQQCLENTNTAFQQVSGTIVGTRVRLSKSVAVPPMNSLNLMEWARSTRHEWTLRETAWTKTIENITKNYVQK